MFENDVSCIMFDVGCWMLRHTLYPQTYFHPRLDDDDCDGCGGCGGCGNSSGGFEPHD